MMTKSKNLKQDFFNQGLKKMILKSKKLPALVNKFESWLSNVGCIAKDEQPLIDVDDDGFSIIPTFRGYNFRGKDCNDGNPNVYPGRKYNLLYIYIIIMLLLDILKMLIRQWIIIVMEFME